MMLYDDGDDDVPASLLIEGESGAGPNKSLPPRPSQTDDPPSMAGPSAHDAQTRWTAAQAQQRLHRDDNAKRPGAPVPRANIIIGDPKEKALWTWINVVNLDHFMTEVYEYYVGAGIWCICLEQLVNLL
jgi:autophagy-related protein 9